MADLEDVKAIDRFVRGLFANTAARRVALEAMRLDASVSTRAEELVSRIATRNPEAPTLTYGRALTLVTMFDEISARDPKAIAMLDADDLPPLIAPYDALAFVS